MRYFKNGELQDERILASINAAAKEYEDGEIIEVRDRMLEIIAAIDEFIAESEGKIHREGKNDE